MAISRGLHKTVKLAGGRRPPSSRCLAGHCTSVALPVPLHTGRIKIFFYYRTIHRVSGEVEHGLLLLLHIPPRMFGVSWVWGGTLLCRFGAEREFPNTPRLAGEAQVQRRRYTASFEDLPVQTLHSTRRTRHPSVKHEKYNQDGDPSQAKALS